MVKLLQIVQRSTHLLQKASVDNAALDARLLIGHVLNYDRAQLITHSDEEISDSKIKKIQALIERRAQREPVARILGQREFWGLPFRLNKGTLEPRPDSETLIETALKYAGQTKPKRILDIGTGSGCLLLALLHEWPEATGLGIDQSEKAIQQATLNAKNLNLNKRAIFQTGNWLDGIDEKFDLIISNPPYISPEEIKTLEPEVRDHDPLKALDGGIDGLDPYRLLIPLLPKYLNQNSMIVFEIGATQGKAVERLMKEANFKDIQITKDLSGLDRCVSAWSY